MEWSYVGGDEWVCRDPAGAIVGRLRVEPDGTTVSFTPLPEGMARDARIAELHVALGTAL